MIRMALAILMLFPTAVFAEHEDAQYVAQNWLTLIDEKKL